MALELTTSRDAAYDDARRALSASAVVPDHRPAVIARVRSVDEAREALAHAAASGVCVTVRSGGHSAAFSALRDGVLALDLGDLDAIEVDLEAGTARVGPGVTSLALAEALLGSGHAFPVGHKSTVALGGYLLAGGNGWNQGHWGSAMESVLGADVLLADGSLVRIDAESDPEAFAALRGAGPGFPGVVVAFDLRLWPEPVLWRRGAAFAARHVEEVAAWTDRLAAGLAPEAELTVFLTPPGSMQDPDLTEPVVTVSVTAFGTDEAHARTLLAEVDGPLFAHAHRTWSVPTDIVAMLRFDTAPPGLGIAAQQAWTTADFATVLPGLVPALVDCPSPWSSILVSAASYRRSAPPHADAVHYPLGTITAAAYSAWAPGERDDDNRVWPTAALDRVREHWSGHYVGEVDLLRTPERLAGCFRDGVLDRLADVRRRLDPDGRFAGYPGGG